MKISLQSLQKIRAFKKIKRNFAVSSLKWVKWPLQPSTQSVIFVYPIIRNGQIRFKNLAFSSHIFSVPLLFHLSFWWRQNCKKNYLNLNSHHNKQSIFSNYIQMLKQWNKMKNFFKKLIFLSISLFQCKIQTKTTTQICWSSRKEL